MEETKVVRFFAVKRSKSIHGSEMLFSVELALFCNMHVVQDYLSLL